MAAGFIAAFPVVLLAALGPRYGGELIVAAPSGPAERIVQGLVHDTLLRTGPGGTIAAGLADPADAPTHSYDPVLTLREGASFHDGTPVRAADAVLSLRRFLGSRSAAAQLLARAITGVEALDERRLVLHLDGPRPAALAALTSPAASVTAAGGAAAGPFVPTVTVPGRRAAVRAFTAHVRGRPYLDTITLMTVSDDGEAATALRDGRVDVAVGAPGVSTPAATLVLLLDRTRPPFDATVLRAAVAATIDPEGLARLLATDTRVPPLLLMVPPSPAPSPGRDLGRGAAVSFGVEDGVPALASQRVVAILTALGLRVTASPRRGADDRDAGDHARLLAFLPEVSEPLIALREMRALVPGPSGADDVLDAAEREPLPEARRTLLARAEAALRDERGFLALVRLPVSVGIRGGIHGVRLEADGRLVLEDAWQEAR